MTGWPITISLPHGLTVSGVTTWALRLGAALRDAGRAVRLVAHEPYEDHSEFATRELPELRGVELIRSPSLVGVAGIGNCVGVYRELLPTILFPCVRAESFAVAAALSAVHADRLRIIGWNHSDNPYEYACLSHYEPMIHRLVVNTRRCLVEVRRRLPARRTDVLHLLHGTPAPSPVDRPALSGRPIRLVYAGRIEQRVKRVMDFVRLAELLLKKHVRFEMTIVGDGPQAREFDRAIAAIEPRARAQDSRIRRHPPVPPHRMSAIWREADVSMLASEHEGLSIQLIEAMACGCVPVVSHEAGGETGMIHECQTGLTFPAGDVAAMAERIASFANDEKALRRMSDMARETAVKECNFERYIAGVSAMLGRAEKDVDRPWPSSRPTDMNAGDGGSSATVPSDAAKRMAARLTEIASRGRGPVAIYGAGGHTIALARTLVDSPVEIVAIVDDDPGRHGRRLWGWPILSPAEVAATGARSVVISSWMHEPAMWQRRSAFDLAGIRTHRLYADGGADENSDRGAEAA